MNGALAIACVAGQLHRRCRSRMPSAAPTCSSAPASCGSRALLAQAQPGHRRAFEREHARGRLRRQCQWHRQRGETHRQHRVRRDQRGEMFAPLQPPRQRRVQRAQRQRAERQRHARSSPIRSNGRPAARTPPAACRTAGNRRAGRAWPAGTAPCVQDRDQQVEREEQQQEWLGRGEVLRAVTQHAPERADGKREHEAEHVERAPRTPPRDREDRRVEHGVVAEQGDVAALPGRQPQRREETGEDAEQRQRDRVLAHREHACAGDQHDAQRERRARRYQVRRA